MLHVFRPIAHTPKDEGKRRKDPRLNRTRPLATFYCEFLH
jgi:hypothetical protein